MLSLTFDEPIVDLDRENQADNSCMSTAKKIDPQDGPGVGGEDLNSLPPMPNSSLLKLVEMSPTADLPITPRVKIKPKVRSRNVLLIAGILLGTFVLVAGVVAVTLYLIVEGVIDIQPSEIKQFLKSLSFK